MLRISTATAFAILIVSSLTGISGAAADTWGCSYDKGLVVCAKVGGKMCNSYCNKQLKDNQLAKTCK